MNYVALSDDIQACLDEAGFEKTSVADGTYMLPTPDAITAFGKRFYAFLTKSDLATWIEEIWDCDDFALTAKSLADIDNAKWRKQTGANSALAFGIAWVVLKEGGGHAINMAISQDENGKLFVNFYEPQITTDENGKTLCFKKYSRDAFASLSWCYL